MDAQNIFNLILLTLSLATILLTLVSYILYRAKQTTGPVTPSKKIKLEGVFFRRYLPKKHVEAIENEGVTPHVRSQKEFIIVPKKIVPFFILISVVIFFSLFVSNALKRKEAPVYASHLRVSKDEIASAGLEKIDATVLAPLARHPSLKDKKYFVFASARGETPPAILAWNKFLSESGLTKITEKWSEADVVIIPQAVQLKDSDRSNIESAINAGKTVIATGAIGYLNGVGKKGDHDWSARWFGVQFAPSSHASEYLPVVLSGAQSAINLTPGLLLNWSPTDNKYTASAKLGENVLAFESDYQGHPHDAVRMVIHSVKKSRTLWMAMDPNDKMETYALSALVEAIAWTAHEPMVKISNWPKNLPGALLLSVDSEDQFSNIASLAQVFSKLKLAATFMVVSHLYQKDPKILPLNSDLVEIGSHSEDHSLFEGQGIDQQYERIQKSLNEIESISQSTIYGFRAPEEKSDNATLLAASKLGLKWMATKSLFVRRAPVWVVEGQLLIFPRITLDDYGIQKINLPPADIAKQLLEEARSSYQVGGMDLLNVHSHVFGKESYPKHLEEALRSIAELKGWHPTFTEAYQWWNARSHTSLEFDDVKMNLTVRNRSKSTLSQAVILVDRGEGRQSIPVPALAAGESTIIPLTKGN